ncbi:hypothetical protein CPB84DRAFT_1961070 [Gymnopilus junonius]|uniref:Uncharacterized protein n=1 Tax=Gymnopilus junonius TaxID=109634 RepID=A0A9P5TQ01_GYMJU|nr:hypothetical protein CPB84DRAFT_1961070 [Gymnopilus junonius]
MHSVDRLPCGIWERIAFYSVASKETFLGPPNAICALSLLSRNIYNQISPNCNTHLYARIFHFKFDSSALERRLSPRWRTTKCLTAELIKRFRAMKRIKAMGLDVDDVWTAHLMLLENDGKNEAQLMEYAGFRLYLKTLLIHRCTSHEFMWFKNPTLDSLVIWLLWETSDRESIRLEGFRSAFREYLIGLLHSFIITGYRFSSTYGPDIYFNLPLGRDVIPENPTGCWQPPSKSEVVHYSHRLVLSAPVVAPAAILSLVVQADTFQDSANIPGSVNRLPQNRASAIAQGRSGPTAADIIDYHLNTRPPTLKRCNPVIDPCYVESLEEEELKATVQSTGGSVTHDEDWYRLVACYDPWVGDMPLRGIVYKPGTLAGRWAGRLLVAYAPFFIKGYLIETLLHNPLYWELQEHHCLSPNYPLPAGLGDQWGDDILNAWLPRGLTFSHSEDAVEAYDPTTGHTTRYETVIPGKAALYSSMSASEKLSKAWISRASDGEIADDCATSPVSPSEIGPDSDTVDDDDEYYDTMSQLSSGVSDILITGKTGEHYGEAWGHFTIYGRVRPWDGLIALLRIPSNPTQQDLGSWVFKGYVHGQNLAGRWRETSTPPNFIGYEGGFVVYKTDTSINF